ncbi:hypothetical protein LPJ38_30935 [Bradyrhizobium daqingense]|uniref:Uncharacterized protein n=1 Tax=Bradyrhizobium daqingense TaxID=993502 RepID=A0A562LQ26_9BRAD|nr:hypothetical protein [Bradyrhizobium daqingense]TWI09683.1 hypothetical protein IQ17_00762 [Bradyrhizobium daqingense]UFS88007.1 hypothetical protein LPJ38_30935 [Bradyrhizobium daqingense]
MIPVKRLILTTDSSAAGALQRAGLADLVIAIEHRLVWGPLPSEEELEAFLRRVRCSLEAFIGWTTRRHGVSKSRD